MSGADAAKRRQLPAWIREGLEKMEREKQRELEKERQIQDALNAKRLEEQDVKSRQALNEDSAADKDGLTAAVKSKFVRTLESHNSSLCHCHLSHITALCVIVDVWFGCCSCQCV